MNRVRDRLFGGEYNGEFEQIMEMRMSIGYRNLDYMIIDRLYKYYHDNYLLYVKLTQPNVQLIYPEITPVSVDEEEFRTEGVFQCDICSSSNTRYREIQTRSGDESFTKFVTCMDCKKTWTIWD